MSRARDEQYRARRARERERASTRDRVESAHIVEEIYGDKKPKSDIEFKEMYARTYNDWHYIDGQGRERIRGSFHDHSYRHLCTGNVAKNWQDSEDLVTSNKVWY